MNFKNLTGTIVLGTLAGCHTPLLLTQLSPETKSKEKFKYYNPDFKLEENYLLNLNGYYLSDESERKLNLSLKKFNEMKKHETSPVGFDINELNITSDTFLFIKTLSALKFYQDVTFLANYFSNKSKSEVHQEMIDQNTKIKQGGSVYKLEGIKIVYENYTQMSGFTYNDDIIGQNTIIVAKSKPYQFIQF